MAVVQIACVQCRQTEGIVKNGKATSGHQRYLCRRCKKSFQLEYSYNANQPGTHDRIVDMTMNGSGVRHIGRVLKISPTTVASYLKNYLPTQ
ncbi:MAG: IS1-like element transposase [Endozoicomonas sp. (ex Botrylloides leachii)]|nr:IS1-like element transposase [Endozoicomonas sp. (ex Botrylloides leachii)]